MVSILRTRPLALDAGEQSPRVDVHWYSRQYCTAYTSGDIPYIDNKAVELKIG